MCLLSSACMWKGEGLIHEGTLGAALETSTGQRFKLVYGEEDRMLAYLGGHLVTMEGRRIGKNLKVGEWHIPAGLHGMAVWFGRLERRGVQLGLHDRNNGAYYLLDAGVEEQMAPFVGQDVLVEGYVAGTHVVKVLHYQILAKGEN